VDDRQMHPDRYAAVMRERHRAYGQFTDWTGTLPKRGDTAIENPPQERSESHT
jgi:hypothetical protein